MCSALAQDNLARSATASASETYLDLAPQKANDGVLESRWSAIPGHNEGVWYQLEWPSEVTVAQVVIHQHDRYVWELDLQAWDEEKSTWRTLRHVGREGHSLPRVVVIRCEPVATRRLRIANITHGPSFTEVQVFSDPMAIPVQAYLGSDLRGNFVGVVSDSLGAMPVPGAEVTLTGGGKDGSWRHQTTADEHGIFTAPMPYHMSGPITVTVRDQGISRQQSFDSLDFQYGLTPLPASGVATLDGTWRFCPDPPEGFWEESFDDAKWSDIQTPSHWVMKGFNPMTGVGGYRRTFRAPGGEGRLKLRFEGVYSGAEVWINGTLVARHDGGATPFEADITEAVHEGENLIAVRATEHTPCSDQLDHMSYYASYPLGGIYRSVSLFRVPEVHVIRIEAHTEFDDAYRDATVIARVALVNASPAQSKATVALTLLDARGAEVATSANSEVLTLAAWGTAEATFRIPVRAPRKWDAEHPYLYKLRATSSPGETHTDIPFGFRQTEVRGSEVLINGRPVKFKGTCHHDQHPLMGRAVTEDLTERDLTMMKQANLNAVRTSHYPPVPSLPFIADRLGLYVEAEAPFCWVGAADDLRLAPRILQLEAEMVARDRNHPSVFMWSLCNESRFGWAFERAHEWVKKWDPTRPCGAATSADLEIATLHNPMSVQRIEEHEGRDLPLFFDESLCIFQGIWGDAGELWIDPGLRDLYTVPLIEVMRRFQESKTTQGSFIWCWSDDLTCVPGRGYEYGRGAPPTLFLDADYKMPGRGIVGDAPWGVVDGWRREKPEFFHTRKLHSPIAVLGGPHLAEGNRVEVEVENRYDFTDLSELTVRWQVGEDVVTATHHLPARSRGRISANLPRRPKEGETITIAFTKDSVEVDRVTLTVGGAATPKPPTTRGFGERLSLTEEAALNSDSYRITGEGFDLAIGKGAPGAYGYVGGRVRRCTVDGETVMLELPALHVLPSGRPLAPVPDSYSWRLSNLSLAQEGAGVRIRIEGEYPDFSGSYEYLVLPSGDIECSAEFTYSGAEMLAREVGLRLSVPRDCDTLDWERRAEWTDYPQDHIGRPRGSSPAFRKGGDGVPPQRPWAWDNTPLGCNDFRSTKRNVYWASLHAEAGRGVTLLSDGTQSVRAAVEPDRIDLHILQWTGGTGARLGEWVQNYGEGTRLATGDKIRVQAKLRLLRERESL
ncbi:MAG: hypothetical protein AMXMBFR61_18250 [Fimbriimonadales bacterium]